MHIMSFAPEHEKHRAVHVTVFLSVTARCIYVNMRFNGLGNSHCLRVDHFLAKNLWPALPFHVLRPVDSRLRKQLLHEFSVGALKRTYKSSLLGPSLPADFLGPGFV